MESSRRFPTQAAVVQGDGGYRLAFTDTDLHNHDVLPHEVFRHLKLMQVTTDDAKAIGLNSMVEEIQHRNAALFDNLCARGARPPNISSVVDIFREVLRYIWGTAKVSIRYQTGMTEEQLSWVLKHKARIVVAVPPAWTSRQNNEFRSLLIEAGFDNPYLRSESKLAGAIHAHEYENKTSVKNVTLMGTNLCVVDIGCSTVNLSAYNISQLVPKTVFDVISEDAGKMAGSELLNSKFREHLMLQLGPKALAECAEQNGCTEELVIDCFVEGFEQAKRGFRGSSDNYPGGLQTLTTTKITTDRRLTLTESVLSIPGAQPDGIRYSFTHMCEVFDAYLSEIIPMIETQVMAMVKDEEDRGTVIMVVGGGSLIPYIQEKVIAYFDCTVIFPDSKERSAVSHGGCIAALRPEIGIRVYAQSSFGIIQHMPFKSDREHHREEDAIAAPRTTGWKHEMPDCYFQIVKPGDNVASGKYGHEGLLDIYEDDIVAWPIQLRSDIYRVDDETFGVMSCWPVNKDYTTQAVKVATVGMDLSEKMLTVRPRRSEGKKMLRIKYRLVPIWSGMDEIWHMVVHPSGEFAGSKL